ncbi:MAG: transposase, partial [Thermodesulfovibrionales bacterium]|nr:transposase [Thermodesulfovibrionales bacterium]
MHGKDYNKQIVRRQRIKRTTLVIGLDIGNEFNAMCLMNKEGEVLSKYPRLYNTRKGFDYFVKIVEETRAKKGFSTVLIGMEPTGHYWRKIAYFAKEKGYEVRFVRTTALRHQRELDE